MGDGANLNIHWVLYNYSGDRYTVNWREMLRI